MRVLQARLWKIPCLSVQYSPVSRITDGQCWDGSWFRHLITMYRHCRCGIFEERESWLCRREHLCSWGRIKRRYWILSPSSLYRRECRNFIIVRDRGERGRVTRVLGQISQCFCVRVTVLSHDEVWSIVNVRSMSSIWFILEIEAVSG